MKMNKLWIAGMLMSQTLSFQASAGLSDIACATFAKMGVPPPAGMCTTEAPKPPAVAPVAVKPPAAAPQTSPNAPEIEETKEVESPAGEDVHPADPIIAFSNKPQDITLPDDDLDPGEYGPENLAGISFGFMHTKQGCAAKESNGLLHKETYCANTDKKDQYSAEEKSGMVKRINEMLDSVMGKPKAKVTVAYFSFSNYKVQEKLCALSKSGVPVRIFLDGGSAGQVDKGIMQNPACLDANKKLNVTLSYLGGSTDGGAGGVWRLHHDKFMMIDAGDGSDVKLNFSSGNLSTFGTSLHLDHWVTTEAPAKSNLIRAHQCVAEGLEAASYVYNLSHGTGDAVATDKAIADAYIDKREHCFDNNNVLPRASGGYMSGQIDAMLKKEQIAPLFSPNDNAYVEKAFIDAISKVPKGGYIYIAIQHFLHGGVKNALLNAYKRGVDVRLIMDDDALRGESEVPGVDQMIEELTSSSGGKIEIRMAETNHGAGGNGQMMHNKLAILNGKMTFSGAGHYTNAALRKNWENFYFVTNIGIISSYAEYFKYLWSQSVDLPYTKSKGATASKSPSKLDVNFLKLAE